MGKDTFKGSFDIDKLHNSLTSENNYPTIKEQEFKEYFMDLFASDDLSDEEYATKRNDWIGRVSHSELSPVVVVNEEGEKVCQVPALLDTDAIDSTTELNDSTTAAIDRFHKENNVFPNASAKLDTSIDGILQQRVKVADTSKWDSFCLHFGLYPNAKEDTPEEITNNEADELFD